MPKERQDPSKDADGRESHPAFGLVSVHRIHAQPGAILFQSSVRHPEYIVIEVHEATRQRDLKHDWVHPHARVCEIALSMSQFASFVASGGTSGIPCTIEYTGSGKHPAGQRPGLKAAPRILLTTDEVRASAAAAYSDIQSAFKKYTESLALSGAGSTAAKKNALRVLESAIRNAAVNVSYAAKCLDAHAEGVVEQSRADIEAMAVRTAERLGIPLGEMPALEAGSDD